jgi:hypothetical protein
MKSTNVNTRNALKLQTGLKAGDGTSIKAGHPKNS